MRKEQQLEDEQIIALTVRWLERAVIGLNLCPFAKAVHVKKQIRYVVSQATTAEVLREDLMRELVLLAETPADQIETTLLVHPCVLNDFFDYNHFLGVADQVLVKLGLVDVLQIASLHPLYQFAGTEVDDLDNYTNRSPYPTLHVLREAGVTQAVAAFPDAATIFDKNIASMRRLGRAGWQALALGAPVP